MDTMKRGGLSQVVEGEVVSIRMGARTDKDTGEVFARVEVAFFGGSESWEMPEAEARTLKRGQWVKLVGRPRLMEWRDKTTKEMRYMHVVEDVRVVGDAPKAKGAA